MGIETIYKDMSKTSRYNLYQSVYCFSYNLKEENQFVRDQNETL